jgi:organic radical activating enzyme
MKPSAILPAWGLILRGYRPFLAVEVTKECPLRCPGCYAYGPRHLNNGISLRQQTDYRGRQLVEGILDLVHRFRPLHLSLVGGEPLIRYRELDDLLPHLHALGIEVQLVTSAACPIPSHWSRLDYLHTVVSVDGLQPEHDARRSPATYARILDRIAGHQVIIHCTVTKQMLVRKGYLRDFALYWSGRPEARKIWFSLYTPQDGEETEERLSPGERTEAIETLAGLRIELPRIHLPEIFLDGYRSPPSSPKECVFAQTTTCISPDLETRVLPCQLGGNPICSECGCIASAGMTGLGRYKLGGIVPVSKVFALSRKFASLFRNGHTN